MYDMFKVKAEAVGSEVHRFGTKADSLNFLVSLLKREEIKDAPGFYAVWAECPIFQGSEVKNLTKTVPGLKFDVTRQLAKDSKIGVTQAAWGLANTGTIVQSSFAVEQRLASSLPWIHVALLNTGNIIADLAALTAKVHPKKNDYTALITGPSRTADIERVLAIGVHGPERLIIICIDEMGR